MFNKTERGFGLIGIIIVVAVAAVFLGGGLYWREIQNQKTLLQNGNDAVKKAGELKAKIERQNQQVVNELIVDTSNWKTYRNEKYGFEVKYPSTFIVEQTSFPADAQENGIFIFHDSSDNVRHDFTMTILVKQKNINESLKEFTSSQMFVDPQVQKEASTPHSMVVGGVEAYGFKGGVEFPAIIFVPRNSESSYIIDVGYLFGDQGALNDEGISKTIISTFKFIPSASSGQAK